MIASTSGELLSSVTVTTLFNSLDKKFDVMVIDSAPHLAVPKTRPIIPTVDNFCHVVRTEQTRKGAIRKTLDLL